MKIKELVVLSLCLIFPFATSAPDFTIVTPKAFRLGATETIVLNFHEYGPVDLTVFLQDYPNRQNLFSDLGTIHYDAESTKKPIELKVGVNPSDILDFRIRQRVVMTLEVSNSVKNFEREILMLISQESGYIFVQTNRPTYRPGETVEIQVFPLDQSMRPDDDIVAVTVKTPDGIGVRRRNLRLPLDNAIEDLFDIPENPEFGHWYIEAKYAAQGLTHSSIAEFVIQRYVLPTFQVVVEMEHNFVIVSETAIDGVIKAHYSYGEPVDGSYFLSVKLKKTPSSFPEEVYTVPVSYEFTASFSNGEEEFSIPMDKIVETFEEGETLETLVQDGGSIYIEATVNGQAEAILESAITPDLPFLVSRYHIDTSRVSNYYTPGLSYIVQADLFDALKQKRESAVAVTITVNAQQPKSTHTDDYGRIKYQLDFTGSGAQIVTIATNDPDIGAVDQASVVYIALPYTSPSQSYLQVSTEDPRATVGQGDFFVTFSHNQATVGELRYYVIARGSIVHAGVNKPVENSFESTQKIEITQNMVPAVRIVAYYLVGTEIVSNSLWIDVVDRCKEELVLQLQDSEVKPGQTVQIDITGSPNALVGLTGVDRAAYFLFNESRLTRDSMFQRMDSYDQGCIRNGGENNKGVFLSAGLSLSSSTILPTEVNSLECEQIGAKRRKRQVDADELEKQQQLFAQIKCDRDGRLKTTVDLETCRHRSKRVRVNLDDTYPGCWSIFLDACLKAERERFISTIRGNLGRSSGDRAEADVSVARQRSDFDESLIFTTVRLDGNGRKTISRQARDSITTFDIDAVSMQDAEDGFCIAPPTELRVFQKMFVQFYVPYALKVKQQANLRLAVFNYDTHADYTVTIEIRHQEVFCTSFAATENWIKIAELPVKKNSAASHSFNAIPLWIPDGDYASIEIRVSVDLGRAGGIVTVDSIRKDILIEELGEIKDIFQTYPLDLGRGSDMEDNFDIEFFFPEQYVPGSRKCWLFGYTNFLGPSIEVDPITKEPANIASLFRKPYGCGEQNMLVSGPNVYAHAYLESAGKLSPGTEQYNKSIAKIEAGYARELRYRSDSVQKAAFAVWSHEKPSTWLNAFVDKVFAQAIRLNVDLDIEPICSSLNWLLGEQLPTGEFRELRTPYHREMHGAVGGRYTLTAYVLISLVETEGICPELDARILQARNKAVDFLLQSQNNAVFQGRPYGLALLSYAIALHKPTEFGSYDVNDRLLALRQTSEDGRFVYWKARPVGEIEGTGIHAYWYRKKPQAVDVEATAYALLAQIEYAKANSPVTQDVLDLTRKVTLWLISQRNEAGAFVSTQDTVIGLQALTAYQTWIATVQPMDHPTDITVVFSSGDTTSWGNPENHPNFFLDENHFGLKEQLDVPDDVKNNGVVNVRASGSGDGVLSYRCIYRTLVEEESCHFTIVPDITITNQREYEDGEAPMKIKLTITISKPVGSLAEMSIVDIGLLTGFDPVEPSIARLAIPEFSDGYVDRYEITNQNVVLYLRRIDEEEITMTFHLTQSIPVDNPQSVEIKVYDYYEPSVFCGQFYNLPGSIPNIRTVNCDGSNDAICSCAEGGCQTCRSRDDQLDNTVCLGGEGNCHTCSGDDCKNMFEVACRSNYLYVVVVLEGPQDVDGVFVKVVVSIKEILKIGDDPEVGRSSNITLMARKDCYRSCKDQSLEDTAKSNGQEFQYMEPGTEIVISGKTIDISKDRNNKNMHRYRLDHTSTLERYITDNRCTTSKKRYDRLRCGDPDYPRSASQESRCVKARKFKDACDNFDKLRDELVQGCD